eukprot:6284373-Pyramimonas_sp.AAC.1
MHAQGKLRKHSASASSTSTRARISQRGAPTTEGDSIIDQDESVRQLRAIARPDPIGDPPAAAAGKAVCDIFVSPR